MTPAVAATAPPAQPAPVARSAVWHPALEQALARARPGDFAVFDADGTIWSSDIEESGIAFFEQQGWLSLDRLDPSLKPLPVRPNETLYGYYQRLCAFDDKLCLPWSAQVFSGQPLSLLKQRIDALYAWQRPIAVRYEEGGRTAEETITAPRIYPAQRALIRALQARGVKVFIVTASHEELVRMVVSDPRYGLEIPPERVIGVNTLLHGPDGAVSTARGDIAKGLDRRNGYWASRGALVPSATLWSPLPWQEGKVASIQAYIDPVRRPILVSGDSANDWSMLFYSGGVRLWVARDAKTTARLREMRVARGKLERSLNAPAGGVWIEAPPAVLADETPARRPATAP